MKCKKCTKDVPISLRECPACGEDNGFPNVRIAELPEETNALAARVERAEASAKAANYLDILIDFGAIVLTSKVAIARSLVPILSLLESDRQTYSTYQQQVAMEARVPEDTGFDTTRNQFESALHPNFHHKIRFGCLTLNNRGVPTFGTYMMILKDEMIAHRATVFEENPTVLVDRIGVLLNEGFPPGYRSTWEKRDVLAKSKLYPKISSSTQPDEYPQILLDEGEEGGAVDYIEVHIYGTFNRESIERITGPEPRTREDRVIWEKIARLVTEVGGTLETI